MLLADESRDIPRCLQCGKPFQVQAAPPPKEHSRVRGRVTDDLIMTWLGDGPVLPRTPKSFAFVCRSCGHAGPIPRKDRFGAIACPACGEIDRPRSRYGRSKTVCLNCGLIVELSPRDRGRTVLCPRCNYFLGCLLPIERERYRPFWSRR
jgi:DNA-directed RNA polymerase subunit RPC12/RpoP